jgi:tetratricopeptide (TPR) repeat protein
MLTGVGVACRRLRLFDEAIDCLQQAVAIHREVRDRYTEGWTLNYFGLALQRARGIDAARACWQEARTILTELGVLEGNHSGPSC